MCLALLALNTSARYPLLMIGNRDESYTRTTDDLHWWQDYPQVLAGRDGVAGGTWYGVTRQGRFGLVTNFREPQRYEPRLSRGQLLADYLCGTSAADAYAGSVRLEDYAGFNLLVGQFGADTVYLSNRASEAMRVLPDGVHALSNALLDTPWPKLLRVRTAVSGWLASDSDNLDSLFEPLADTRQSAVGDTPELDLPDPLHRALTAPFISGDTYGTRSTSLTVISNDLKARCIERRFGPGGTLSGESSQAFSVEQTA